jgi:hypothetical protein
MRPYRHNAPVIADRGVGVRFLWSSKRLDHCAERRVMRELVRIFRGVAFHQYGNEVRVIHVR